MTLDAAELAVVCDGLRAALVGGRPQRIRDDRTSGLRLWLRVRTPGENHHLLIAVERGLARMHRAPEPGDAPDAPSGFVMGLRKRINGAPIVDVRARPGERIARVEFAAHEGPLTLIAELTGRDGNVFLVDGDDRILASLVTPRSSDRTLTPGHVWVPPTGDPPTPRGLRDGWPDDPDAVDPWLAALYAPRDARAAHDDATREARKRLTTTAKRLRRRLAALESDLDRADRAETWRRYGELLRGAFGRVARGADGVDVQDWFVDGAPTVRVPLDPKLDLAANIERYFHRARRAERGGELALERIDTTQAELDRVEAARSALDDATGPGDVDALLRPLVAERIVRRRAQRTSKRDDDRPRLPWVAYTSSDGLPILVGRGSADNDRLTFGHARGRDHWLHAADHAGSHVIIRLARGADPPHQTLLEAAILAAFHSRARNDSVVTVHHLPRHHVRKPKGLPPGRVTIASPSAIDVRMDPDEVQRVLRLRDVEGADGG